MTARSSSPSGSTRTRVMTRNPTRGAFWMVGREIKRDKRMNLSRPRRLSRHCRFSSPSMRGGQGDTKPCKNGRRRYQESLLLREGASVCPHRDPHPRQRRGDGGHDRTTSVESLWHKGALRRTGHESTHHFWLSWASKWVRHPRAISCITGADLR